MHVHVLLDQEVKRTRAEFGRSLERIGVLAPDYGQSGPNRSESPSHRPWPDLVAGLAEGERELLLAGLTGAPEEPAVGGVAGDGFGGGAEGGEELVAAAVSQS